MKKILLLIGEISVLVLLYLFPLNDDNYFTLFFPIQYWTFACYIMNTFVFKEGKNIIVYIPILVISSLSLIPPIFVGFSLLREIQILSTPLMKAVGVLLLFTSVANYTLMILTTVYKKGIWKITFVCYYVLYLLFLNYAYYIYVIDAGQGWV